MYTFVNSYVPNNTSIIMLFKLYIHGYVLYDELFNEFVLIIKCNHPWTSASNPLKKKVLLFHENCLKYTKI